MTETNDTTTNTAPGRLPTSSLLLGAGGILLIIGALLPWVTIAEVFSISGVGSDYGIIALLGAAVALVAALGAGRVFSAGQTKPVAIAAIVLGVLSLAAALYVGFAIRDAVAEDEVDDGAVAQEDEISTGDAELDAELEASLEGFAAELEAAFTPTTGIGVYTTALGGLLVIAGGAMLARRPTASE